MNESSGVDEASQRGDYNALLAGAIARQALSISARQYVTDTEGLNRQSTLAGTESVSQRIRYFAGKFDDSNRCDRGQVHFTKGHFRPDLVNVHEEGDGARS
ncbi:hypothetical protein HF685_09720 [Parasphingorhabdus halotolerans]|uniref:Uncharacterized protein n=1 Tax=Parasphingorhabdus halotolerans TaxID=2725558 RepID=A0A6H2DNF7_9SPHN|nr:hypothetical protein HF685_09720 [Parasphingorhabdus halotolerans]